MKVYITKYALSIGIFIDEGEECKDIPGMIDTGRLVYYHGEGMEWHKSIGSALKRANIMRENKIKSIKKKLKELENIDFSKDIRDLTGNAQKEGHRANPETSQRRH